MHLCRIAVRVRMSTSRAQRPITPRKRTHHQYRQPLPRGVLPEPLSEVHRRHISHFSANHVAPLGEHRADRFVNAEEPRCLRRESAGAAIDARGAGGRFLNFHHRSSGVSENAWRF